MQIKYFVWKNKIFCLYVFRLKSQEGPFLVYTAVTGGYGMHQLAPVDYPPSGYDVPYLKEQTWSSALYLIPWNSDIDVTSNVNDISVGVEAPECHCSNCHEIIARNQFQDHKMLCTQKKEEVDNGRMCKK